MAKSKEQKRQEALERLTKNMQERKDSGQRPTFSQQMEHSALSGAKRPKTEIEKIFGVGDPVTGTIWAKPLPWDFKPTPELDELVYLLKNSTEKFVEVQVSLECPEGYPYATYEGNGTYLDQWVQRHTTYVLHHGKNLFGTTCGVVFSHKSEMPTYDDRDNLISGTPKEVYEYNRLHSLSS